MSECAKESKAMAKPAPDGLSRRERQIMDVLYRRGVSSVAEVLAELPDAPSYSAMRALIRILEEKGHVRHEKVGGRYFFRPIRTRESAGRSALQSVLRTFFDNSAAQAMQALLDASDTKLSRADLDRLVHLIEQARTEGR
jgi:BlaI family penicillinase repressor